MAEQISLNDNFYPRTAAETSVENPWQVSTLAKKLKDHINRAPKAWVEGEIVEINKRANATYITLRDVEEEISLPLSVWGVALQNVEIPLEQGNRVVAQIRPDFWLKTGKLSMQTSAIKKVGIGDLLVRIELLRKKLVAEGLFALEHKKVLPFLPHNIGLITGHNSDAKKDVIENAVLRWPSAQFTVREVAVQGVNAVSQICLALEELDANRLVDVIVIARGGGALEDLLPFSSEVLVRKVFGLSTVVVSAIGHEADRPLLDEVADLRASTPTDAAKRIVPDMLEELRRVADLKKQLLHVVRRQYLYEKQTLGLLRSRPGLAQPLLQVSEHEVELRRLTVVLHKSLQNVFSQHVVQVGHLSKQLLALSPQMTLERGYAVVQTETGRIVKDSGDVELGEVLTVQVAKGKLVTNILEKF